MVKQAISDNVFLRQAVFVIAVVYRDRGLTVTGHLSTQFHRNTCQGT